MKSTQFVFILASLNGGLLFAVPTKFHKCDIAAKIIEPSSSQGFYMDSTNCKTVYVLPPLDGRMEVGSYVVNQFNGVCDLVNASIDSLKQQSIRVRKQQSEMDDVYAEIARENSQIDRLQSQCFKYDQLKLKMEGRITWIQTQLDIANERLDLLIKKKNNCAEEDLDCLTVGYDITDVKMKISDLQRKQLGLKEKEANVISQLQICEKNKEVQMQNIVHRENRYQDKSNALALEQNKLQKMLQHLSDEHADQEGATLSVHFYSGQSELVQKFKVLNSELKLDFQPINIKKGILSFQPVSDEFLSGLPVIRKSMIAGLNANTLMTGLNTAEFAKVDPTQANIVFGQGAGGSLTINQVAACELHRQFTSASPELAAQKIIDLIAPTVTFNYEVLVGQSIDIQFSESHLYQLMKKQVKSNGLFRSSSANSLLESSEADKWLTITIKTEDLAQGFGSIEATALELRKSYLDSALVKVAKSYLTSQQTELIEPGVSGASKVSERMKGCPFLYCQYAAIALDTGNALFGGSASEADMKRILRTQELVHLEELKPVSLYGTQTLRAR